MIRFLKYITEQSLSRLPSLSERHIGIAVFDRAKDWDPKVDPIVRIEARRLRQKLALFYERVPVQPEIILELPKGGYQIEFRRRASDSLPMASPIHGLSSPGEPNSPTQRPEVELDPVPLGKPQRRRRSKTPRWLGWSVLFGVVVLLACIAYFIDSSQYRISEDRGVRLIPFRLEGSLSQELDGHAMVEMLGEDIRNLQRQTRVIWSMPPVDDTSQAPLEGGRIRHGLSSLARTAWAGGFPETMEVSGLIYESGPGVITLYVRGNQMPAKSFVGPGNEWQSLLVSAAEYIFRSAQPCAHAVYLTEHDRGADAAAFISEVYPRARARGDRQQLLYSWAMALSEQGDHRGAVDKLLVNIGLAPRSWGSYTALQQEYEELGETGRAIEVGHELERRAHRGSWLFQHLPEIVFRKPSNNVFASIDEMTGDYGALRQSIELDLLSQEGGTALYPLYAGYATVLSRLHERRLSRLELDLARSAERKGANRGEVLEAQIQSQEEEGNEAGLKETLIALQPLLKDTEQRDALLADAGAACALMFHYDQIGESSMSENLASAGNDGAECLFEKARREENHGQSARAEGLFRRAITKAPEYPSAHYMFALFLLHHGREPEAIEQLHRAHEYGPHWAEPLAALAELDARKENWAAAELNYAQAIPYAPSWGLLRVQRAETLIHLKRKEQAEAEMKLAANLDLNPSELEQLTQLRELIERSQGR